MGADIYYEGPKLEAERKMWEAYQAIEDPDAKERMHLLWKKAYEQMDENYFRDSYNNSSVFWQMGLSWWADVGKVLDDEGCLPIVEAMKLWKYIEKHPIVREEIQFKNLDESIVSLTEKERDEWFEYFTQKRKVFMEMLDRSIKFNSPLICSV